MQVKCFYAPDSRATGLMSFGDTIRDNEWSTSLTSYSNGRGIPISKPDRYTCAELYILGGRSSIAGWLRAQGQNPVIYAEEPLKKLHVYLMRKHRILDKDLTMLLISPRESDMMQNYMGNTSWAVKSEGSTSRPFTTPAELAVVVENAVNEREALKAGRR